MLSISLGARAFISPSDPSIRTSGLEFDPLPMVPVPRILRAMVLLRAPPEFPTERLRPGIIPCSAWPRFCTGRAARDLESMEETAPVRFTFFCVPYPTTTTSWVTLASSSRTTSISVRPETGISSFFIPIKEKTRVAFRETPCRV